MNTSSVALKSPIVKKKTQGKTYTLRCAFHSVELVHEFETYTSAETRAHAHLAAHPGHIVKIDTTETEVLRAKESKL